MTDSVTAPTGHDSPVDTSDREADHVLDPGTRGTLDIRVTAIEHIVEYIAADVPGTVVHSSGLDNLRGRGYPRSTVNLRGVCSWITLDIAVAWTSPVQDIAATTRGRVLAETQRLSSTQVQRVDVVVHVLSADQIGTPRRSVQ